MERPTFARTRFLPVPREDVVHCHSLLLSRRARHKHTAKGHRPYKESSRCHFAVVTASRNRNTDETEKEELVCTLSKNSKSNPQSLSCDSSSCRVFPAATLAATRTSTTDTNVMQSLVVALSGLTVTRTTPRLSIHPEFQLTLYCTGNLFRPVLLHGTVNCFSVSGVLV